MTDLNGGIVGALAVDVVTHDEPATVSPPPVEISTEALLEAATIELRGYGPDGTPGTFLYDCAHDGERLVCTQRGES